MNPISLTNTWTPEDQQRYENWTHSKEANHSIREKVRLRKERLLALAEKEIDQELRAYAQRERAKEFNKGLKNKYVPPKNIDPLDEVRGTSEANKRSTLFTSEYDAQASKRKVGRPNRTQILREQALRHAALEQAREANATHYTNKRRKQLKQKYNHLNEDYLKAQIEVRPETRKNY